MPEPLPTFIGLGLFTGRPCSASIRPAPRGSGIMVHPLARSSLFEVSYQTVTQDTGWAGLPKGVPVRNTTVADQGLIVATVEHLMSALAGLGIWDCIIELTGSEIPILDGSARDFVEKLVDWPVIPAPAIRLREPVEVRDDTSGAFIRATPIAPGSVRRYTYRLDYGPASPLRPQECSWDGSRDAYIRDIAPARTFSMLAEARSAQAMGLFRNFSPRTMLVIGDDGHPVDNAWRFDNEPARHKLLDLIGDLALLGSPLDAEVVAHKAGHAMTHELCRRIATSVRETTNRN